MALLEGQNANGDEKRRRTLDDLEGECLSGNYEIVRRIGKGGMGVVYLAKQTKLGRDVCVKVLNSDLIDNEDALGRFQREARGLSILHHPNIVTIFDYGRDGDLAYIVMEYAQGITLGKYIKHNGAMSLEAFLPVAVQILKGIGEAHKLGLIHRDIKPANIMLCELEGEKNFVKILDFGLAKLAKGDDDVTKEHQLVGSASYMSPEQILTGASDTRTDVYALGVMFYLMLAGRKPFVGPNDNVILYKHVNEAAAPLKTMVDERQNVPDALCEVIDQCLVKDPAKRPANALDLLHAISYALDAPQLRAGYSSMSLGRIDLQKISEEAETHMFSPLASIPQLSAITKEASCPGLSGVSQVSSSEVSSSNAGASVASVTAQQPSYSQVQPVASAPSLAVQASGELSSVTSASGISFVQPNGVVSTIPVRIVAQSTRDRKFLLVSVCLVAAALAISLVFLFLPAQPLPTESASQTPKEEISEMFREIDNYLAARKIIEAENFLGLVQARPDAQDVGTSKRIVEYQMKIDTAKVLQQAAGELKDDKLDKAQDLFQSVLDKDPENVEARSGLAAVAQRRADQSKVVFNYDGNFNDLDLYINDVYHGHPDREMNLEAGIYSLRIERDGYEAWNKKIQVSKSDSLSLDVELGKKPAARPARKPRADSEDDDDVLIAPTTKKSKSGKRQQGLLGI